MTYIIIAIRDSIRVLKGLSNKMMLWHTDKVETDNPKLRKAVKELESALQKIKEVQNQ